MDQVMRLLLGILALGALGGVHAQSWCPPGAQWHVTTHGFAHEGYLHRVYDGDTLFQGRIAQRITETGHYFDYWPAIPTYHEVAQTRYTSLDGDVLLVWLAQPMSQWDTLIWFGAVPGDRWYAPGTDGDCGAYPAGMREVTDTTTTVLFGMPLRRIGIVALGQDGLPFGGIRYFHQRIGLEYGTLLLIDGCLNVDYHETLRCYSDDDISYVAPNWSYACASGVSVHEHELIRTTSPFPNPGTDHFSVLLHGGPPTITLFDATGRMMMEQRTSEERPIIGTEGLPTGMYIIRIVDSNGASHHHQWIKS